MWRLLLLLEPQGLTFNWLICIKYVLCFYLDTITKKQTTVFLFFFYFRSTAFIFTERQMGISIERDQKGQKQGCVCFALCFITIRCYSIIHTGAFKWGNNKGRTGVVHMVKCAVTLETKSSHLPFNRIRSIGSLPFIWTFQMLSTQSNQLPERLVRV